MVVIVDSSGAASLCTWPAVFISLCVQVTILYPPFIFANISSPFTFFFSLWLRFFNLSEPNADFLYFANARFFSNTGAVAGTFSVVGLVGLAFVIFLITTVVRRRQAKQFDREIQAAANEAARAPKPIFLDDEDAYGDGGGMGGGGGGGGGGGYDNGYDGRGYSDISSHGTYAQPPMSASSSHGGYNGSGQEAYGMREIPPMPSGGVAPGEIFDPYVGAGGAAGAAGIGAVRARSMRAAGGQGTVDDAPAPYAAFAAPTNTGYDPYSTSKRNADILEAAGMGAHLSGAAAATATGVAVGGLARGQSLGGSNAYQQQQVHQRSPSQDNAYGYANANLARNKSGSMAGHGQQGQPQYDDFPSPPDNQYYAAPPAGQSYASHYQQGGQYPPPQGQYSSPTPQGQYSPPQPQYSPPPQAYPGYNASQSQPQMGYSTSGGEEDMDDAYGGYVADSSAGVPPLPNPFDGAKAPGQSHSQGHSDPDSRYSDHDQEEEEEEEEPPKRVLKVANE